MAVLFNKKARKPEEEEQEINVGQVYVIPQSDRKITVDTNKSGDLLRDLKQTTNKYDAIDLLVSRTPDGKMAFNTYLRIANQGLKIQLMNMKNNKPIKKYDAELRQFCAHMGGNTSEGLDGLVDQLHASAITHGGMAVEVVVKSEAEGIDGVLIIDPKTISEFEWIESEGRWAAYQKGTGGQKKNLFDGNFFWIPHQPKPGRPDGTLMFEPAIAIEEMYYQFLQDISVFLDRIALAKYNVSIDLEKLLASATPEQLASTEKRNKLIKDTFDAVKRGMQNVSRDSNIIHYDSTTIDLVGGGEHGSGIDVRAWFESLDPLIVNAYQLTPVLMGRLKSGSYSLGTAEYKIVKDTMEVLRRASKRMVENIINIWARVNGYAVYAVVTHNPIEWQVEREKYEAELLRMQRARRAEEYRWLDHETSAIIGIGDDAEPQPEQPDMYEYLSKVSDGSEKDSEKKEDKKSDESNQ